VTKTCGVLGPARGALAVNAPAAGMARGMHARVPVASSAVSDRETRQSAEAGAPHAQLPPPRGPAQVYERWRCQTRYSVYDAAAISANHANAPAPVSNSRRDAASVTIATPTAA
jgi:hypothetical protein